MLNVSRFGYAVIRILIYLKFIFFLAVFKVNIFYLATNVFQVNYRFVNLENVNIL